MSLTSRLAGKRAREGALYKQIARGGRDNYKRGGGCLGDVAQGGEVEGG